VSGYFASPHDPEGTNEGEGDGAAEPLEANDDTGVELAEDCTAELEMSDEDETADEVSMADEDDAEFVDDATDEVIAMELEESTADDERAMDELADELTCVAIEELIPAEEDAGITELDAEDCASEEALEDRTVGVLDDCTDEETPEQVPNPGWQPVPQYADVEPLPRSISLCSSRARCGALPIGVLATAVAVC
jgi:hypothetical protein